LTLQKNYTNNLKILIKMEKIQFKIEGEYIELIQLLKAIGLAQTGGHAKMIVDEEMVMRNGELETRKRAKLLSGDVVVVENYQIELS
jgi:ribosome-associated protein